MQTLTDPFEVPAPPVAPERFVVQAGPRQVSIEIELDLEPDGGERVSSPPSPDSSGRLRCWCSED